MPLHTDYRRVAVMNEGLLRVASEKYGMQLFTRVKLRKNTSCAACGDPLNKGTEAFSPLTNGYNRMHRVCFHCLGMSA